MRETRLIIGLGNPGKKYEHTRHNVGFDVIEILAQREKIPVKKLSFAAQIGEGELSGCRVILARPQTFMNDSGRSVREMVSYFNLKLEHLLVIYDDIDLKPGVLRIRQKGSAGTHNGMRSIIFQLNGDDFPRIRVGIGAPPPEWELADYVLSHYGTKDERAVAFDSYVRAADAAAEWVGSGIEAAMRNFNGGV